MKKTYEHLWLFEDTYLNPRSKYGEIYIAIVFNKKIDEKYVDSGIPFRKYQFYFTSEEELNRFEKAYDAKKHQKI